MRYNWEIHNISQGVFSLKILNLNLGGSDGKESACNAGDSGSTPGLGRSHGEGSGNPLQYSCLGNPIDREARQATVLGVSERVRHDLATKEQCPAKNMCPLLRCISDQTDLGKIYMRF